MWEKKLTPARAMFLIVPDIELLELVILTLEIAIIDRYVSSELTQTCNFVVQFQGFRTVLK
jgi:hypothetical protein